MMFKSSILMLTMLSSATISLSEVSSPICDMEKCSGYYKLNTHKIKKPNIGLTKTKVKVLISPKEVKVAYVKRRWLTIYCYDGTFMDPSTGCYETITSMNPSCKDANNWIEEDQCPTGWECAPDGDGVADLANSRCYDSTTVREKNGPKVLKWQGTRFTRFPVHTCTSSWECNKFHAVVPIFAKFENDSTFSWVFYDKDNKEHKVNTMTIEKGIESSTGEKLCPLTTMKIETILQDAECYSENIDNINCVIISEGPINGIVFDVSQSGMGVLRNMMFEVKGQLLVPENGTMIDINKTNMELQREHQPYSLIDKGQLVLKPHMN